MGEAWRIVKAKHAATAFTGEGAAKTGGRWNSRGVAVVYVSGTKSLATLENLVHLNPPVLFKYVSLDVKFDDALVEMFPVKNLPADWRAEPPPPGTRAIGDDWVKTARTAILALPSVITGETNYLFNLAHPDFKKVTIGKPEPFVFDPRLLIRKP
jgi:RES domain-containing protein